jgi:hypothetical protein
VRTDEREQGGLDFVGRNGLTMRPGAVQDEAPDLLRIPLGKKRGHQPTLRGAQDIEAGQSEGCNQRFEGPDFNLYREVAPLSI